MLSYPIRLSQDNNQTFLATSPDFPELTTFGNDRDDALLHAVDALEEAIAARISRKEDVPLPSAGRTRTFLSTQTAVKVLLYRQMRSQGLRKADLARALAWKAPQVDRLLDIRHASRLDSIDAAFAALGGRLSVEMESRGKKPSR